MNNASILKKAAMAITGLGWFAFTIGHLGGNLLLYKSPEDFNAYASFLEGTGELLILAELGLIVFLLAHLYLGIQVTLENARARSDGYAVSRTNGKATAASRTMIVAGVVLFIFIVTHVWAFKFGDHHGEDGLWGLVIRSFQNPLLVAWYVIAMVFLGLHLSHGIGSAFQSLGVVRPSLREKFKLVGNVFGWILAAGFISLPIYAFIAH